MQTRAIAFSVDERLLGWGISVGFLVVENFDNRHPDERFATVRDRWSREFTRSTRLDAVIGDPKIKGYRALHDRAGCSREKLIPSPESLYPILFRDGGLRTINPLVDIYNFAALRNGISCGAHDIDALHGRITLQQLDGDMTFLPLGRRKPESASAGEYGYINGAGNLICRLECKQAAFSAVSPDTTAAVVIAQCNAAHDTAAITETLDAIQQDVIEYCVGAPTFRREVFSRPTDQSWDRVAQGAGTR